MIFPKKNAVSSLQAVNIQFQKPSLIDLTSFQINVSTDPTNFCLKTLSANTDFITNTLYQWYLNGIPLSNLPNPQIDASVQFGTITLTITFPTFPSSNACSTNGGSVTISKTIAGCTPPNNGTWTWMGGDNWTNQTGVYGIIGVGDIANKPGGRAGSSSWTDSQGNMWLFGGKYTAFDGDKKLNDLWKYDISTNIWTWMKGSNLPNQITNYGVKGIANNINTPGSRYGAQSWVDAFGNLWLYGGWGISVFSQYDESFSDLWKYNVSTNQWTWVSGSHYTNVTPIYGTQSMPSNSNDPGCRGYGITWIDATGNFWLFGGVQCIFNNNTSNYNHLNDLWKYNPSSDQWTWMKGSNTPNQAPSYGTKGVVSATNQLGNRIDAISWKDGLGNFWFFGGKDFTGATYNDLWKFNITNNNWVWISGDNSVNQFGNYGQKGIESFTNKPGSRHNSISWVDSQNGNLWLFGGEGNASTSSPYQSRLNDLWRYNISSNKWTWISGDDYINAFGNYGTLGVTDPNSKPSSRHSLVSWRNSATSTLWLFGGVGRRGMHNDLWKYKE